MAHASVMARVSESSVMTRISDGPGPDRLWRSRPVARVRGSRRRRHRPGVRPSAKKTANYNQALLTGRLIQVMRLT